MRIQNEGSKKFLRVVGTLCAIVVIVIVFVYLRKKDGNSGLKTNNPSAVNQSSNQAKLPGQVLVQAGSTIERVDIETGKIEPASTLEQEDFSGFVGLPKVGDDGKESTEQSFVLASLDQSKAIVDISVYDQAAPASTTDGTQPLLKSSEFVCTIAEKKCEASNLLTQNYQGLNPDLQKQYGPLWWFKWDSAKNWLYGNISSEGAGNVSPVYICNTENKSCQKTAGFDSLNDQEVRAVVPEGALSPAMDKFVMINQHDKPNEQTGKQWELMSYQSNDLTQPALKYDISLAIDSSENVSYDSVQSVAWSQDEKKIAFATSHKIMMLDFTTGKLELIYDAPFDEENGYSFDGSEMALSADGKYIVFADTEDNVIGDPGTADETVAVINVLKKIDLTKNNEVSELMRGSDLSLKL